MNVCIVSDSGLFRRIVNNRLRSVGLSSKVVSQIPENPVEFCRGQKFKYDAWIWFKEDGKSHAALYKSLCELIGCAEMKGKFVVYAVDRPPGIFRHREEMQGRLVITRPDDFEDIPSLLLRYSGIESSIIRTSPAKQSKQKAKKLTSNRFQQEYPEVISFLASPVYSDPKFSKAYVMSEEIPGSQKYDLDSKLNQILIRVSSMNVASCDYLDKVLTRVPIRTSYLVIGSRGVGKSSLLHYFFKTYSSGKWPFVIVDFLNYGWLGDAFNVLYLLKEALRNSIERCGHNALEREFPQTQMIFSGLIPDTELRLLKIAEKTGFSIEKMIGSRVISQILSTLGEVDIEHIAREQLQCDASTAHSEGKQWFGNMVKKSDYKWVEYVIGYIVRSKNRDPAEYLYRWIMFNCESSGDYVSKDHDFPSLVATAKAESGLPVDCVWSTLDFENLEKSCFRFVESVRRKYGHLVIVVDNADRLHALDAEIRIFHAVASKFALDYRDLKIVLAMRSQTLSEHQLTFNDARIYDKMWMPHISFEPILLKRIKIAREYFREIPGANVFLDYIEEVLHPSNVHSSAVEGSEGSRNYLISIIEGFAGDNIRKCFDLLGRALTSHHIEATGEYYYDRYIEEWWRSKQGNNKDPKVDNESLWRRRIATHKFIKALILGQSEAFAEDDIILNILRGGNQNHFSTTLIRPRILEVVLSEPEIMGIEVGEILLPLGYSKDSVMRQTSILVQHGLLAEVIAETSERKLYVTSVGEYYYRELTGNLAYCKCQVLFPVLR